MDPHVASLENKIRSLESQSAQLQELYESDCEKWRLRWEASRKETNKERMAKEDLEIRLQEAQSKFLLQKILLAGNEPTPRSVPPPAKVAVSPMSRNETPIEGGAKETTGTIHVPAPDIQSQELPTVRPSGVLIPVNTPVKPPRDEEQRQDQPSTHRNEDPSKTITVKLSGRPPVNTPVKPPVTLNPRDNKQHQDQPSAHRNENPTTSKEVRLILHHRCPFPTPRNERLATVDSDVLELPVSEDDDEEKHRQDHYGMLAEKYKHLIMNLPIENYTPVMVSRNFISQQVGGGMQAMLVKATKYHNRNLVFPNSSRNPVLPENPGDGGILLSLRNDLHDRNPRSIFLAGPQQTPQLWEYMGEYTSKIVAQLPPKDYKSLPTSHRNDHIEKLLK